MNSSRSLSQFKFDVWLIEQLQTASSSGLTLEELRNRWIEVPGRKGSLSRDMLTTHRKSIEDFLGIRIEAPDRMHYRIMNPEVLRLDSLANDLLKSIQNFAYSGFGGRGGKHGDFFWDNESYAIKHYMKKFADLASAKLKQVADWFVWLASTLGKFNANELKRADHEVHDIADGRYDGRIQKYQQGLSR